MAYKFRVRDRVEVLITYIPGGPENTFSPSLGELHATSGIVARLRPPDNIRPFQVLLDSPDGRTWWFSEKHLCLEGSSKKMPEPEFDLEDMELAEIIMEELK